ncbi:MAG: hypothetical protein V1873_06975 [Verrucomicrobiota bacterium]
MRRTLLAVAVALLVVPAAHASQWGRNLENRNAASLSARVGSILSVDGTVRETYRPFFDVTGQDWKQKYAKEYTLDELGFTDSYPTYGLEFEKMWKYVTLRVNGMYVNPSSSTTAERRDAYISVNEVKFEGKSYDHMVIPKGQAFDADMQSGFFGLRTFVTPFTLEPEDYWAQFVPSIYVGIFGFVGSYEIDAGPAQGLTTYELPPHTYVIGGTGKGDAALAIPEIGIGGELTLGLGERRGRNVNLVVQGHYSLFQFQGSTSDLGIDTRYDKLLDLDYDNYEARVLLEIPMTDGLDLIFGAGYQYVKAFATVEAAAESAEEIIRRREKFDKEISFKMSAVTGMIGIRF